MTDAPAMMKIRAASMSVKRRRRRQGGCGHAGNCGAAGDEIRRCTLRDIGLQDTAVAEPDRGEQACAGPAVCERRALLPGHHAIAVIVDDKRGRLKARREALELEF